jgi:hypothetical protein
MVGAAPMEAADTAQAMAVVGALGAVLALVGRARAPLLAGLVLLAVAEAGLAAAAAGHGLDSLSGIRPATALLGIAALVPLVGLAFVFVSWPFLVTPFVLAAAPFRLPLDIGSEHRFFVAVAETGQLGRLLPLYLVLGAAAIALATAMLRGLEPPPLPRIVAWPTAAFLAFASLSLLWSSAVDTGANLLAYFLLPFTLLVAVVARAPFPSWMPRALATIAIALGCLFATIGIWQAATERLLFFAPKLEVANTYGAFFRVTSLFRDPSLYGRQVVLAAAVLLVCLWLRRIHPLLAAALLAVLWAGLYFSYSQSSMVALAVVTVAVTLAAGDRLARRIVLVASVLAVLVAGGFLAAEARDESARRVTSDRSRRVDVAAEVFRAHPVAGAGLGSQPTESQARAMRFGPAANFVSHTTPLTVAAELGAVGVALYLALLGSAAVALRDVTRLDRGLGLALGAVLLALVVHSLFYSGFFEDPITWLVLGLGARRLSLPLEASTPAHAGARPAELVPAR